MLLLGPHSNAVGELNVWTARAELRARAEDVLDTLTDPALIAEWTPIAFDVAGISGPRLVTGSRARVTGSIAGVGATFDVHVLRADRQRLELLARGPVCFEVVYFFREQASRVVVDARVAIARQGGLAAHVLRAAATALLNAGALAAALKRMEGSLYRNVARDLVAA